MKKDRKRIQNNDTDKAFAVVGSSKPEKLKTDEPLAEKDEVKQAEENMRKRLKQNKAGPSEREIHDGNKISYHNRPHMLFR